jgi:thiamine-phosphate pyrophosphorylase
MTAGNHVLRILDANFNRAREAFRVMEEYARFVLDDPLLTQAIKDARHQLSEFARTLAVTENTALAEVCGSGPQTFGDHPAPAESGISAMAKSRDSLVRARDIEGDVGRITKADGELDRATIEAVALAASKRLSEALRVIEEVAKIVDSRTARRIEGLRYCGYELERRLVISIDARRRFADVWLYVIITASLCRGDWYATARAAIDGGADAIQLREKDLPDRELLSRAKRLAGLCREHGKLLIINDRPDIAAASGADGVHLGQDDVPVSAARRVLPARCIIGVSTHTVEQVEAAARLAPDYLAVGPMFPTETKPQTHIAGPETLAAARRRTSLPLAAIGGINAGNVDRVCTVPACTVCVCAAVIQQPDVAASARDLRSVIEFARRSTPRP